MGGWESSLSFISFEEEEGEGGKMEEMEEEEEEEIRAMHIPLSSAGLWGLLLPGLFSACALQSRQ